MASVRAERQHNQTATRRPAEGGERGASPQPASAPGAVYHALARVDDPDTIARIFQDLFSTAELRSLHERWAIIALLRAGHSQRAVRDAVGCSIATVSRGAAQLRGSLGGFDAAFAALEDTP
jgi:uncharacterized protein YerC